MGHNIKPGVATGKEVQAIFKLAKEKGFALPAVMFTYYQNLMVFQ